MKKALIIFLIVFFITLLAPLISTIKPDESKNELVTLFHDSTTLAFGSIITDHI